MPTEKADYSFHFPSERPNTSPVGLAGYLHLRQRHELSSIVILRWPRFESNN